MKHRIPYSWRIRLPVLVHTHTLFYRKRKRFLAFARNDGTGKAVFSHHFLPKRERLWCGDAALPPSYGRRESRRGGGWLTRRNKKEWVKSIFSYRPPKRSRGRFFVDRSLFPARMKRRDLKAYGVPCFPFSDALPFLLDRKRKRFLAALEMTRGRRSPLIIFRTAT